MMDTHYRPPDVDEKPTPIILDCPNCGGDYEGVVTFWVAAGTVHNEFVCPKCGPVDAEVSLDLYQFEG